MLHLEAYACIFRSLLRCIDKVDRPIQIILNQFLISTPACFSVCDSREIINLIHSMANVGGCILCSLDIYVLYCVDNFVIVAVCILSSFA